MPAIIKTFKFLNNLNFTPRGDKTVICNLAKIFGLITAGDAACQFGIEKANKWNYKRSFRQAFVGSCLICPMNMLYLSRIAPQVNQRLGGINALMGNKASTKWLFRAWA
jgi:hypothetical protein